MMESPSAFVSSDHLSSIHLTSSLPSATMSFADAHGVPPAPGVLCLTTAVDVEPWTRLGQCAQLRMVEAWSPGTSPVVLFLKRIIADLRQSMSDHEATAAQQVATRPGAHAASSVPSAWIGLLAAQSPMPAFILPISADQHSAWSNRLRRCRSRY